MEKPSTSSLKFTPEMKAALDRFINSEEYQAKLSAFRENLRKDKAMQEFLKTRNLAS
ncbi:MAG: hypothetical protein RLZZ175_968 [Bacteroidota bacterium]|jgi:hypothetical protein